ncbi:unnamed protein product [Paramecium octaurelia]|uniref:Uncharacterized protein n=1 Tax=Paramecium octaurelia TaxID=43137 RepID=A0A8S1YM41_PAROT|nr:unnamed protein product [Paramecium octaurelia]
MKVQPKNKYKLYDLLQIQQFYLKKNFKASYVQQVIKQLLKQSNDNLESKHVLQV